MKIWILVIFCVLYVAMPAQTSAQLGLNAEGYVGLANMGTPETLGQGSSIVNTMGRYSQYGNDDPRGEVGEIIVAAAHGITDRLDLSFLLPFVDVEAGQRVVGKISFSFKYRLFDSSKLIVSLFPTLQIPVGKGNRLVKSNQLSAQFETGVGVRMGALATYASAGYGIIDYLHRSTSEMKNVALLRFSGGVAYRFSLPITLFVEVVGERVFKYKDEDLYFQLGGIWRKGKNLIFKGSAGVGLPDATQANTEQRAVLGFAYLIDGR